MGGCSKPSVSYGITIIIVLYCNVLCIWIVLVLLTYGILVFCLWYWVNGVDSVFVLLFVSFVWFIARIKM